MHRVRQLRTAIPALVRDERQRHQPPFPDPVTVPGLRRLIAEFEPEIIHAYGWLAFSVAAALGRKRIPMLVSARDYGYFCATRTLLRKGAPCSGPGAAQVHGLRRRVLRAPEGVAGRRRRRHLQTDAGPQDDRPAQRQHLRPRRHRRAHAGTGQTTWSR